MSDDGDVIPFRPKPPPPPPKDKRVLKTEEIDVIGFLRGDDTDFYISDRADIAKVFAFIARSGIKIYYGGD